MTLPFPAWLQLREAADAEARAAELVEPLRELLRGRLLIRDLGCGTGSMARWLAPRLPGPQHWILYDRDPELLARAGALGPGTTAPGAPGSGNAAPTSYHRPPAASHDAARTRHDPAVRTVGRIPAPRRDAGPARRDGIEPASRYGTGSASRDGAGTAARDGIGTVPWDGAGTAARDGGGTAEPDVGGETRPAGATRETRLRDVTVETRLRDVTGLTAAELAGTSLVTTSALLDMLTGDEVDRIAAACSGAGCPALLTLSVSGRVRLTPGDPLDREIADAFDAHQRRTTGGRRLLGPDAPGVVAEAFRRHGARVWERPSPWRLGPGRPALTAEWLRGWVGAACEQRPTLAAPARAYLGRRLAEITAGELSVVVGHSDLLVRPG